ncbi:MAG: Rossmann-like and DUF2520 domain-containing protein [Bacteroidales bacterium]
MESIKKVVLIGSGNVATQMGLALAEKSFDILQVYSQTLTHADELAKKLNSSPINQIKNIRPDADMYIISVSDNALIELTESLPLENIFLVHTSGSTPMEIFRNKWKRYGVLYPLQTLSKSVKCDFSIVPLCIEASDKDHLGKLLELGKKISSKVYHINSDQREDLHIAAVFASNFTNHMYAIASDILENKNVSFEILHPLLDETLRKAKHNNPAEVQTGPAVRGDKFILEKHREKLSSLPAYQKIYNFISQNIYNTKKQ